jgi:hypothetical protein
MRQFLFVFTLLIISCNKNNDKEVILVHWNVTKVEGPASGNVNQTVALTVSWPYGSGSCDVLDKFEETKQGNIIYIKAYGHTTSGICTMDAGIKTKTYNFRSASAGTFELRFVNRDNTFISHTIVIS